LVVALLLSPGKATFVGFLRKGYHFLRFSLEYSPHFSAGSPACLDKHFPGAENRLILSPSAAKGLHGGRLAVGAEMNSVGWVTLRRRGDDEETSTDLV
jgi:hypothetical protein